MGISSFMIFAASLLLVPVAVFAVEVAAGIVAAHRNSPRVAKREPHPPLAVLVPAHDESAGIRSTVEGIRRQLRPCDRILVVADNCTDDTAALARFAGAEVVERNDVDKRGKGFALDKGIRHLSQDPREIVIVVDADCTLADKALENLAFACAAVGRPIQGSYLMLSPGGSQVNHQVAQFAWRVKNWLRPVGLHSLGLPCQLTGSGMAFPWKLVNEADLANAEIVEDMKLGLDLAMAGYSPEFCPSALITSEFARSQKGAGTQRKRWEQGHLTLIFKFAPRLLVAALARRDPKLLSITLDLTVPPISLLGLVVLATFGISLSLAIFDQSFAPLIPATINLLVLATATFVAWLECGRDVVPVRSLLLIPSYTFRKLRLYYQLALGRTDAQWTRTERAD